MQISTALISKLIDDFFREGTSLDKRKVILAYQRGFLTIQECAQILGIDAPQIMGMVNDPKIVETSSILPKQSINS
jgi:predicted DNA-binding ArsR family transcriptional regulator